MKQLNKKQSSLKIYRFKPAFLTKLKDDNNETRNFNKWSLSRLAFEFVC